MNCSNCGKPMSSKRENAKYDSCGLDYVTLLDVEVRRCHDCGEQETVIPNVEGLSSCSGQSGSASSGSPSWTGDPLSEETPWVFWRRCGKGLSARPETMSRWENDKDVISPAADRFLRLMVAQPKSDSVLSACRTAGQEAGKEAVAHQDAQESRLAVGRIV